MSSGFCFCFLFVCFLALFHSKVKTNYNTTENHHDLTQLVTVLVLQDENRVFTLQLQTENYLHVNRLHVTQGHVCLNVMQFVLEYQVWSPRICVINLYPSEILRSLMNQTQEHFSTTNQTIWQLDIFLLLRAAVPSKEEVTYPLFFKYCGYNRYFLKTKEMSEQNSKYNPNGSKHNHETTFDSVYLRIRLFLSINYAISRFESKV